MSEYGSYGRLLGRERLSLLITFVIFNCIAALDFKSYGFASKSFNKDLHSGW